MCPLHSSLLQTFKSIQYGTTLKPLVNDSVLSICITTLVFNPDQLSTGPWGPYYHPLHVVYGLWSPKYRSVRIHVGAIVSGTWVIGRMSCAPHARNKNLHLDFIRLEELFRTSPIQLKLILVAAVWAHFTKTWWHTVQGCTRSVHPTWCGP